MPYGNMPIHATTFNTCVLR